MKIQFKKTRHQEWHESFAWLPTSVDDSKDKHTVVWFEKYMRKRTRRGEWYRLSKKEYFNLKQNRDYRRPMEINKGYY